MLHILTRFRTWIRPENTLEYESSMLSLLHHRHNRLRDLRSVSHGLGRINRSTTRTGDYPFLSLY